MVRSGMEGLSQAVLVLGSGYETNRGGLTSGKRGSSGTSFRRGGEDSEYGGAASGHQSWFRSEFAEFSHDGGQFGVGFEHRFFKVILERELFKPGVLEPPSNSLKLSQDRRRGG